MATKNFNSGNLKVQLLDSVSASDLTFAGVLDESVDFRELITATLGDGDCRPVRISCKSIERINSVGVRTWVLFINELQTKRKLEFLIVGDAMVEQASLHSTTLGNGDALIHAIMLPYACPHCHQTPSVEVKAAAIDPKMRTISGSLPLCLRCATPMKVDVDLSEYLGFLSRA